MGLLFFCTGGQIIMTVLILVHMPKNIPLVAWTLGFLAYDLFQISKAFGM